MKVYKMVEMARNNDPDAKDWLNEHYEPIVKNYVLKKYGQDSSYKMNEMLPSLIDYYFEHKIKDSLGSFLCWKADLIYKERKERKLIGGTFPEDEKNLEFVIEHYSNKFYEKIKHHNKYLSDVELKKYSYKITKDICFKYKDSKNDFRFVVWQALLRETKYYDENEELFLQMFASNIELTCNVYDYFYERYSYLLDKYKSDSKYEYLSKIFPNILIDTVLNFRRPAKSIKNVIVSKLFEKYKERINEEKQKINKFESGNLETLNSISEDYSYIKNVIFNKFVGKVIFSKEELIQKIEEKYNDYVNAYMNGTRNSNTQRYINTRLTEFFNRYLIINYKEKKKEEVKPKEKRVKEKITKKPPLTEEEKQAAKTKFDEYSFYIDKYLKKIKDVNELEAAKKRLQKAYDELFEFYCAKQRKTAIEVLIRKALKDEVDNINNSYVDADEITLSYKDNNSIVKIKEV